MSETRTVVYRSMVVGMPLATTDKVTGEKLPASQGLSAEEVCFLSASPA